MYWSHTSDTFSEAISNAMRCDRFDAIIRCLHFNAADDINKSDKFAKLRPLISHLQKKFMEHFVPAPKTVTGVLESKAIKIIRWMDNALVKVESTIHGNNLVNKVKRWSKEKLKHIQVPIPQAIYNYNKNMGGTDQMDQNINAYRIGIRMEK
ncbi:Hypothetical predicted protein [Octopus vulgaris]|uniref:PiggyBac transposable element-derived protein domain-containing protein n=1 Tax=Octopus vulgaris TaxID=6645 RepID=A0AA36F4R6_OCTVU|nr:Hypothetical predicted protein [Octopus vulgaris]